MNISFTVKSAMAAASEIKLPRRLECSIACQQGAVRAVRYNVDGEYCMTCGSDKTLKLWNPGRQLLLKTYMGHGYEVLDACGSSDNAQLASGSADKCVINWDVESGKILKRFRAHAGRVNAVAFNEESTTIFSASLDGTVRAWDTRSASQSRSIQVLDEATDNVTCVSVSDHEILTGSADCHVRRYDLRQGQMYADFMAAPVTSVSFTRDGQCLLVAALNNSPIRLFDKSNGQMLSKYTGHSNAANYRVDACLLASDSVVLSGSEGGHVLAWDLVDQKLIAKLDHPIAQVVHSLSAHPSKTRLMTAAGQKVYLWTCDEEPDVEPEPAKSYPFQHRIE